EVVGIQIPGDQGGVGEGRLLTTLVVAGGAGHGAGALGAHLQVAAVVDPADAPAAGADGADVDHRHRHRKVFHLGLGVQVNLAVDDQRGVQAGAAHVQGDDVGLPDELADVSAPDGAAGRAGVDQVHRLL